MLALKSFLSANAVRATNSMDGIDWCSSNNSTPCAVRNITVPVLITTMGAHYFIRDNEIHFEMSASKDKDFIVVRRHHARHPAVRRVREDSRPVFQYGEELLRLRGQVDQRALLITKRPLFAPQGLALGGND